MADQSPPPSQPPTDTASPALDQPAAPRKKRRIWLKVLGAIALLLILLIVFLPSLASTGPVKSLVVGKINDNLNGSVEINDWSIGWTSGVDIDGVKVLDQQGVTVLTVSRVRVPIKLIDAARGNYEVGDMLIERPDLVKLVINEDGTTNYGNLVKSDPSAPKKPAPKPGDEKLPAVKGKITIRELKGSIFKGDGPAVMVIQPSDVVVDIPDINGPITNDVKLAFGPAGATPGTITLAGNVDAIEDNEVAVEKLAADQKLGIANVDFAALGPILRLAKLDATLAGIANGAMAVKVAAGADVSANGEIKVDRFAFGGKILNGDTFGPTALRIPLDVTSVSKNGVTHVTAKGTGVHFDQGSVVVSADAPMDALQNAAAEKAPGADGAVVVDVKVPKLADIANMLPNTLKLAEGVKLIEGSLSEVLDVKLAKDAATVTSTLDLTDVKGTKDGQPLRPLDPVHLVAGAKSFGGQDLRDLVLNLKSGFATIDGGGESLAKLNVTSNVDLKKLREQAGQFTDALDQIESGTGTITLTTDGDLTKENSLVATTFGVELRDLNVVQPSTQPSQQPTAMLREPWMKLGVNGQIQRGKENFVEAVNGLVLTLQTNNPQKPTVDVEANADVVMKPEGVTAPMFKLAKLNVDIPAARGEFRTFLQVLDENGLDPTAGQITLSNPMAGSYDGKSLTIANDAPLALVIANVTMQKTDPATKAKTTPIDNRTIRVNAAGNFDLGETFGAKLSQLALVEDRKLFSITKAEQGDFVVRIPKGASPQGSGAIVLMADLVGLNQVLAAFGSPLIEKQPDGSMDLQGGLLGGRIQLAATDKETNIDGAVDIKGLTLTTLADPIKNETIQAVLKLKSPADGSALTGSVNVVSSFVKAMADNLNLQLTKQVNGAATKPATWEMIQRADVTADVESLSKVYALSSAFSPTTQPTLDAEGKPLPPLAIQSGSAKLKLAVKREQDNTSIDLSEARISNLALTKGPGSFKSQRDMVVSLTASLDAADAIKQITVSKLAADLAVANATLEEPLVVTNLDATPAAKGALRVDGKIEEISRLLEALAGQAPGTGYPYGGQLTMTQRVSHAGGPIQLEGSARATNFIVYQQDGKTPAFTEKELSLNQNVTLDTTAKRAAIQTLVLDMPSSGALKVNVTGGLSDWAVARKFDDNTTLELAYDLAKLWPVVKPLMSSTPEDYKELVIEGKAQKTFALRGSYPAKDASERELKFHESIKSLTASGGLFVQKFNYLGIDIADYDIPIKLADGQLVTVYADRPRDKRHPPPAKLNGGTMDLGGLVLDLTHEQPRLSIAKKQRLLSEVTMNPLFAHNVLGKWINPSFVDPEQARGLIDLTVGDVTNVPLGDLITQRNDGTMYLILSIREVSIGNKFLNTLLDKVNVGSKTGALTTNIRDAQLKIQNGILTEYMPFQLDDAELLFDGQVRLKDQALLPLNLRIPTARLKIGDDVKRYVPEFITVPITGTTTAPKWNLDVVVQNLVVEAGKKALLGNVLERAGGGRQPAPGPGGATSQPTKPDPVGGLLEDILGGRRKREEEPRR